jgi:rhomboid protease GluP
MRQTQGSMICPKCERLIGVNEPQCPFCGAWRPGLYGWSPVLQRFFGNRIDLIAIIVMACGALYVASLLLDPGAMLRWTGVFGILSPSTRALFQLGMTSRAVFQMGWWWTVLTAIYLHGGLLHIFFNLMWIRNLGPTATQAYGPARAFVIFSIAGAAGFVVSDLASASPSIGASGSIFGLLAALIVYGRRHGHAALTAQLWQWAILVFVMGFVMQGVNNWAHAGGFAGGWVTAELMRSSEEKRESPAVQVLALILLVVTAVGIPLSFVRVTAMMFAR